MTPQPSPKATLYIKYPLSSVLLYNIVTILHFSLGGIGIITGYQSTTIAYGLGVLYLVFAFGQMYGIMPLRVCPNCIYVKLEQARCTSGLNLLSRRLTKMGDPAIFSRRSQGVLCHNNLYMAALIIPVVALLPALIANFSAQLVIVWLAVTGLLLFRFFVIFGKVACLHCKAKQECPNAEFSGVREK